MVESKREKRNKSKVHSKPGRSTPTKERNAGAPGSKTPKTEGRAQAPQKSKKRNPSHDLREGARTRPLGSISKPVEPKRTNEEGTKEGNKDKKQKGDPSQGSQGAPQVGGLNSENSRRFARENPVVHPLSKNKGDSGGESEPPPCLHTTKKKRKVLMVRG